MMFNRLRNEKGFTMIELVVTVLVIGILAAISVVVYEGFLKKARTVEAQTFLNALARQQTAYYVEHDEYTTEPRNLGLPELGGLKYYRDITITTGPEIFTATAKGNIDSDDDLDEWSINQDKELKHESED